MDRSRFLEFAKNADERLLLSRVYDLMQRAEKTNSLAVTQFLNGHELSLAQKALAKCGCVCFSAYGGYDGAERNVIAFHGDIACENNGICVIKVSGREIGSLSHRDFLGSILALGIRRETVGDIIIGSDCGYIICTEEISGYILSQLERVARTPVSLSICDFSDIKVPPKQFKEIKTTVPSLRLDAVIGAGLNLSRSEAVSLIKSGKVSINWEQAENTSLMVREGQVISIKGFGRIELSLVKGETKKGRLAVVINRFI